MSDLATILGGGMRQDTAMSRTSPLLQALIMSQVQSGSTPTGVERILEEQNQELARIDAREQQSKLMQTLLKAEEMKARGALDKTFVEQLKDTAPIHGGNASLSVMQRMFPGYGSHPATAGTTSELDANRILQGRAKAMEDAGQGVKSAAQGGVAFDPSVLRPIMGQGLRASTTAPTVEHQDQLRGKQVEAGASNQRGRDMVEVANIQAGARVNAASLTAQARAAAQGGKLDKVGTEQRQFTRDGQLVTETVHTFRDRGTGQVVYMNGADPATSEVVDTQSSTSGPHTTGGAATSRMGVPPSPLGRRMEVSKLPGTEAPSAESEAPKGVSPNQSTTKPQGTTTEKQPEVRGGVSDVTNDPAMATALSMEAEKWNQAVAQGKGGARGKITSFQRDAAGDIWAIIRDDATGVTIRHAFTGKPRQEVIEEGRKQPRAPGSAGQRY